MPMRVQHNIGPADLACWLGALPVLLGPVLLRIVGSRLMNQQPVAQLPPPQRVLTAQLSAETVKQSLYAALVFATAGCRMKAASLHQYNSFEAQPGPASSRCSTVWNRLGCRRRRLAAV
jgi:hypothetical protein